MRSRAFIYISLAADVLIAVSKFIAAGISGSSSMVSEAVHSVIDAISQLLLIFGIKTSRRKPDQERPFGYGKEFYFWSFIVSLIIFIVGGCISFYQGLIRLHQPEFKGSPTMNYIILGIAFVFNSISLTAALKVFNKDRGDIPFFKAVVQSKDPSVFIAMLGDIGDLLGVAVAFLGVFLGRICHNPYYDGIGSLVIGAILIAISLLLVRESKSLLMGETTSRKTIRRIIAIMEADEAIVKVKKYFSTYLAPEEVLLQLIAVFKDGLDTRQITDAIDRVVKVIKNEFPRIKQIFIEPAAA